MKWLVDLFRLPDQDISTVSVELEIWSASVDLAYDVFVEVDFVSTSIFALIFLDFLDSRVDLDIEITVDLSVFGFHLDGRFDTGRECDIDIAAPGAERHRLTGSDLGKCYGDVTAEGVGHDRPGYACDV